MSLTRLTTDIGIETLRINEIFLSLQGETSKSGLLTAFIRLTGCPLRCQYCDTAYAFHDGDKLSIKQIIVSEDGNSLFFMNADSGLLQQIRLK